MSKRGSKNAKKYAGANWSNSVRKKKDPTKLEIKKSIKKAAKKKKKEKIQVAEKRRFFRDRLMLLDRISINALKEILEEGYGLRCSPEELSLIRSKLNSMSKAAKFIICKELNINPSKVTILKAESLTERL